MTLGERIRDLRLKRGMTLEQVGELVGVGKSTVRKWESGQIANMRRDKIALIAKALDVSPAYLMGWIFPQRLSDIITYRHLTYDEVAEAIDVEPDDIDRMVAGDLEPTYDQFKALAEYLNVTEDCLEGKTEYDIVERGTGDDDDDLWTLREELRRDPGRRVLFDLAKNGSAQDIRQAVALIDALKATNPDYYDGDDPA